MSDATRCALCGCPTPRHNLFVTREAGVEVGTNLSVPAGTIVCWQHAMQTPTGEWVRSDRLGSDYQTQARDRAVLK